MLIILCTSLTPVGLSYPRYESLHEESQLWLPLEQTLVILRPAPEESLLHFSCHLTYNCLQHDALQENSCKALMIQSSTIIRIILPGNGSGSVSHSSNKPASSLPRNT